MVAGIRRIGIALGSFFAACLSESLVLGAVFGPSGLRTPLFVPIAIILGALIYQDIMRREAAALDPSS
jgi:hypothetical protein